MGSYIDLVYIWGLIFSQVAGVMSFSHFPTAALLADSNSLTYTFATRPIVVYVSLVQKGWKKSSNNKHVTYFSFDFQIKNR